MELTNSPPASFGLSFMLTMWSAMVAVPRTDTTSVFPFQPGMGTKGSFHMDEALTVPIVEGVRCKTGSMSKPLGPITWV